MKNILSLLAVLTLYSCNSNDYHDDWEAIEKEPITLSQNDGVIYPLAEKVKSRICYNDSVLDWSNASKVTLPNGQQVDLPWIDGGSLPFYMQEKLSPDNGWELIAHTMYPETQADRSYMLFHNYITGTLRVFSYMSTFATNNNGYWRISFSTPNSLLNFTDEIAIPSNQSAKTEIIVSNSTTQSGGGFALGWNGFELDLAYDPDISGIMKIEAMNHNTTDLVINGDYDSSTNGTIVGKTSSSSNVSNLIEGVGKLAGNAAESWLKSKVSFTSIDTSVSNSIYSLANKGIGAVFGMFSSLFKEEGKTTETVNLTTHGTIKVEGTSLTETAAPIVPVNIHLDMLNTSLGGWNLTTLPNVFWYTTVFPDFDENSTVTDRIYTYKVPGIQLIEYNIITNPKASFNKYIVSEKPVGYYGWTYSNTGNMVYGKNAMLPIEEPIYDDGKGNKVEDFSFVNLCLHIPMPEYETSENLPFVINILEAQETYNIEEYDMPQNTNVYLQVSVNKDFVINGVTNTYICTRTYECKHDWGSEY